MFNDVAITNKMQKPYVLHRSFMADAKTTRESRQHRLHKIVTTLARELDFVVFRLKFKMIICLRVRPAKRKFVINFEHPRLQVPVAKIGQSGQTVWEW